MSRWLWLSLFALLGCAGRAPRPASDPNLVLPMLNVESARPFALEQRLSGRYGEREMDAHVVLQWNQGVLRLIGLAPFGARAFLIEQRGSEVHVESSLGRELPFDPKHVLIDIHRVLFRSAGEPQTDGAVERVDGKERIRDLYRGGVLVERRYAPIGAARDEIVITYEGKAEPVIAKRVTLKNLRVGYALHIETLSQSLLESSAGERQSAE